MDDERKGSTDLGVGNYELLYYMVNPDRAFQPIHLSEEQDFNRAKHFKMEPTRRVPAAFNM